MKKVHNENIVWRLVGTKFLIMTTPEKTENKIDHLVNRVGVTEKGNEWLKTALDPFSDVQYEVDGYPDKVTGNSVVQKITKTFTVSRATGSLPDANWDANIYFSGFENTVTLKQTQSNWGIFQSFIMNTQSAGTTTSGGVCVAMAQTGIGPTITQSDVKQNVAIDAPYLTKGTARVISKGMEIHNTTAELQKQGAVITWRVPDQNEERVKSTNFSGGGGQTPTVAILQAQIPHSAAEAIQLPGSKQWEASEGCYVTAVLSQDLKPISLNTGQASVNLSALIVDDGKITADRVWFSSIDGDTNSTYVLTGPMASKYNNCGAFFTGLSSQTTLQVTVHWFLERFPAVDNLDLIVLAKPSPSFDPQALELYSKTAINLPTGTMVKNNDLGAWIKQVADTLQEFGVPGMPLVKGAVSLVSAFGMKKGKGKTNEINKVKALEKRIMATEKRIEKKVVRVPTLKEVHSRNPYAVQKVYAKTNPFASRIGQPNRKKAPPKKKPFQKRRGKKEFNV